MHLSLSHPSYPRSGMGGDYCMGICKSHLTIPPPLGTILCYKSPAFCIGIPRTTKILGQMPQPWGQIMLTNLYKSLSNATWGRWGLTMIGALSLKYNKSHLFGAGN